MADIPEGGRFYSEKEIGDLLKRATELQGAEGGTDKPGLSLDEVTQIAAEMGIDPGFLQAAAREHAAGTAPGGFELWGAPPVIELTREFAGTVTQERWEEIVEDTRRAFGAAGNVTQRGAVYEWKAGAERDGYQARLTLSTKDGKTKAHLVSNRRAEAGVLFVSLGVLVALLTFLTFTIAGLGVFSSFGVAAASLLVFWVMARFAFRSYSGKKRRTFEALLDRAEARLAEAEPAATEAVAPAWDTAEPNTPILDLDEPEPDPETAPGTRRKTSA
jgi:hypothetical protein